MSEAAASHRGLLASFALGHMATDWAPGTIWIIAPAIALAMDLSPAEVGLLITFVGVGKGLGYLPAGVLADRVENRGRLLLATFWWVAIGYLVASLAPGFWSVAVLLAVAGLGNAAWHPIATGVLVQCFPTRRAQAIGAHAMAGTFAEVLSPLAAGFLLGFFDWRAALAISLIPATLMGVAFLRIARSVPASPQRAISLADLRALAAIWRKPRGLALIAMASIYNMAVVAIFSMAPLFLQRVHGLSVAGAAMAFSAMLLAGALFQPLAGRLSDTAGRKPVIVGGAAVACLVCLAVVWGGTPAIAVAALIAAVGALYGIRSAVLATVVEFSAQREATTLGLAFTLLDGVGALGAALAGAVASLDLHYAFLMAAGLALSAAAIGAVAMRR